MPLLAFDLNQGFKLELDWENQACRYSGGLAQHRPQVCSKGKYYRLKNTRLTGEHHRGRQVCHCGASENCSC